jgi:phosphate transport system permease protein
VVLNKFPRFPFLRQDLRHFSPRDPVSKAGMEQAIIGSIEQVGLATAMTVPIGVLTATYLNEVGGRFASCVRTIADAMTGLPSIIAGLFIYAAWVQPQHEKGFSGFAAAIALAVVMLPTVIRTAEEVLRLVSGHLREAALALGAPEWRVVLRVVIPTARTGLVTAAILGVARAVGETAPVLLTAFGSPRTNLNPFRGTQDDLPMRIYLLVRSPSDSNNAAAWGGALLLLLVILTLFTLARMLGSGRHRS